MAGFEDIGALLGVPAGNELSYQKGLALGANTQNAMQQARERVRKNTAMEQLGGLADELGVPAALLTAVQAGVNPRDITGASNDIQAHGFRETAASPDPNVDAGTRNRALYGVASGPVKPFEAVGSKGYQDILHPELGVMELPGAVGGGGDAAAIQVLRAFGFLDDHGHVPADKARQAFDVMRTTGKTVDEGGVPGVTDFNPFVPHAPGGTMPAPAAAPAAGPGDLSALVPPPPAAVTPAPAPAPAVAGPGAVQPISSAARVAGNTAEIERQKVIGHGAGEAAVALPQKQATTANQIANADVIIGDIDKTLQNVSGWTTGPAGAVIGFLPGTPAYDFKKQIARIQANVGFKELAQMRHESPTGGALGQVSERELEFLQSTMGSLDTAQSPAQAAEMLGDIRDSYGRFKKALARDMAATQATAGASGAPGAPAAAGPGAYADQAKEARYQAWKAAHGGQ